ncbi:MAG: hypothetical protein QOK06_1415, partial [Acidimicrobiaceae bacterium]
MRRFCCWTALAVVVALVVVACTG